MVATALFPIKFQRQGAAPIDVDSVFTSTTARLDYLTSERRYAGQLIADIEDGKAYVMNDDRDSWIEIVGDLPATPTEVGTVYGCNAAPGVTALGCCVGGLGTVTGTDNVAIGCNALASLINGCRNIAIGVDALTVNEMGNDNVAIGSFALSANLTGSHNVGIGYKSLYENLGSFNTAMGQCSLFSNTTGSCNTAIGVCAGSSNTSGSNNIFIGCNAQGPTPSTNNTITLGDANITNVYAYSSSITAFSDCRDKTNICSIPVGLEFIKALRPVKFQWNIRDVNSLENPGNTDSGFIAQELDNVVEQFNADWMKLVSKDNPNRYEVTIGKLLPVVIKAIQELATMTDEIQLKIN